MKNILRVALFSLALAVPAAQISAQRYKTAVGIRMDQGVNLTAQQFIANGWTAEAILHTPVGSEDIGLTLLAEKHRKIIFRGFNLYTGGGLHYYTRRNSATEGISNPNVWGASFIGGAELSLGRLNFAVDWKPELHLSGDQARPFSWNGAAFSLRYIIAKRERRGVKDWGVWDRFKRNR
jgi:hypothetical protein